MEHTIFYKCINYVKLGEFLENIGFFENHIFLIAFKSNPIFHCSKIGIKLDFDFNFDLKKYLNI